MANSALDAWKNATDGASRFGRHSPLDSLRGRIAAIYRIDTRGATFPLSQAVRLFEAYARQHERLSQVNAHIQKLRGQHAQLEAKLARLHQLGEDHEVGRARLDGLKRDIAALEASQNDIRSSCARLDALVARVHHFVEVKTLQREISDLAGTQTPAQQLSAGEDELHDIERQITREIDTFLMLERETDAHLRDV